MLHPSRVLLTLLMIYLFTVGVMLETSVPFVSITYIIATIIIILFFWRILLLRYIFLALLVLEFSLWQIAQLNMSVSPLNSNTNYGRIVVEPKLNENSQSLIVETNKKQRISFFAPLYPSYSLGDEIEITGTPTRATDDDYYKENKGFFLVRGIDYVVPKPRLKMVSSNNEAGFLYLRLKLIELRKDYEKMLSRILGEPQAGIAKGILLGTRSGFSKDVNDMFVKIGIIHIMALSGYNITIIAENVRRLIGRYSAKISFFVAFGGVWAFVAATGFSSSVVRAAIMGSILLLARRLGRQADAFIAITFAASIMVLLNPYLIRYDVGFQLSFAAMAGLLLLGPLLMKMFKSFGNIFGETIATTLAAQIFTLPLLSFYFGRISLISVLANLLVLPMIPLIMLIIFLVATIGFLSLWLATKIGFVLWIMLTYILKISEILSTVPAIEKNYTLTLVPMVASYLILLELILILKIKREKYCEQSQG